MSSPVNILVIDDDPAQLSVRTDVLCSAGLSVHSATTAEAALEQMRDTAFAASLRLIVTDHLLPGASGAWFVREVRKAHPEIPVLVITGMDTAEPDYADLRVTFLHKPCNPDDLIAAAHRAICDTEP